jgi:YaiO family outer membrane protein
MSDRTQLNATLAAGEETEATGPGQILRTDVEGFSFGVRHGLNDRWRLSGWLGSHAQGDFYTRRYVGLSLTTGF